MSLIILTQTASNYISAFGACKAGAVRRPRSQARRAFNHLQTLSFSYFNQNSVGYVHARVMSDTDRIASTLAWSMAEGVWHIGISAVCAIVMMLILNWKMALVRARDRADRWRCRPCTSRRSSSFYPPAACARKTRRITGAFNEGITGATTTKTLVVEDRMETGIRRV